MLVLIARQSRRRASLLLLAPVMLALIPKFCDVLRVHRVLPAACEVVAACAALGAGAGPQGGARRSSAVRPCGSLPGPHGFCY